MAWPQYTNIKVHSYGWVSSTGHHFVSVDLAERRVATRRVFLIDSQVLLRKDGGGYLNTPKYVVNRILGQLKKMVSEGTFRFCEYDRNGNPRWENLRYYDHEQFMEMVGRWQIT